MKHWTHTAVGLSMLATLALAGPAAFAQNQMMQKLQARFEAADQNHDGKLTKSEAKAGMPRVAQYFEQIDTDNTGAITFAQIGAFMAKQQR